MFCFFSPFSFCRSLAALKKASKLAVLMLFGAAFAIPSGMLQAQFIRDWNNTGGGGTPLYNIHGNWLTGFRPDFDDTARFNQAAGYEVWWDLSTQNATPDVGFVKVWDGNVTFLNKDATQYELIINGSFGGSRNDFSISGATLTVRGLHMHSLGGAEILNGSSLNLDGSHSAGARLSVDSSAFDISGDFTADSGAIAFSQNAKIALFNGSVGTATISGGSLWSTTNLTVGDNGSGTLDIDSGGSVNTANSTIGLSANSNGIGNVTGPQSEWSSTNDIYVGYDGDATLNVELGGLVSVLSNSFIATNVSSTSDATVTGAGSQWNTGNLYVGGFSSSAGGNATLNIVDDGLVSVGGTTKIWSTGNVNLNGGRFEFGETSLAEFSTINANSGSMAGNVNTSGYNSFANLSSFQNPNVDLSDVNIVNSGVLYGVSALDAGLTNLASGELRTGHGEITRFSGNVNTNDGEINNFGGLVEFENGLTNQSGGFISGRGQFISDGGWTNQGVMALSGGFADVLGDVLNDVGGQIVTAGGGVTTFYDDVVHNGTEIHTASQSRTVFFGDQSGAGAFTGTGTIFYEGDLRPGNSPDIVDYEGSVVFGAGAGSFFEIGGLNLGEYDRLDIAGDLSLDGQLSVDLINGFELGFNQEFLVADVGGLLSGQYDGLTEGALIGSFDGMDLFISYEGGDGNDVAFFTSVPEPGTCGVMFVAMAGWFIRRRSRS